MIENSFPMAAYQAIKKVQEFNVNEIETSGWIISVGDEYSNAFEGYHIKVTRIVIDPDGSMDPDDAIIHVDLIDPDTKEVLGTDHHRAWHINENWYL